MKVVWSDRAVTHLTAVRDHIAKENPKAAQEMAIRILESVDLLADQPHLGRPGRIVGTRELVIPGTPYLIPYRVRTDRLELIALFYGRQKWPKEFPASRRRS
jgi:toxin ParE1/3/4